jgi:hypothetical protein
MAALTRPAGIKAAPSENTSASAIEIAANLPIEQVKPLILIILFL